MLQEKCMFERIASLHFLASVSKINFRITWQSERISSNIYFSLWHNPWKTFISRVFII